MTIHKGFRFGAACVAATSLLVSVPASAGARPAQGGLAITRVTSTGAKHPLLGSSLNVITYHVGTSFSVSMRNLDGPHSRDVAVTLRIPRVPSKVGPIVKTMRVHVPPSGAMVTFRPTPPIAFAVREPLTVTVRDRRTGQAWSRSFPIIFALG